MLPRNPLPQLILNRVQAAFLRVQGMIWIESQDIQVQSTEHGPKQISWREAVRQKTKPLEKCSFWGKLFDQRWCHLRFPKTTESDWLHWKDQGEATLFIDGKPYFGFDVGHRFCRLPKGLQEVWIESHCVQSAIWHSEANGMDLRGAYFENAFLAKRNELAWNTYHDLKCLFDLAMAMRRRENPNAPSTLNDAGFQTLVDRHTPTFRQLLRYLDEAIDAGDTKGLQAMNQKLAEAYRKLKHRSKEMHCVITGHAHLDLVWIWPERIGEAKAVHIFATANRLMEEYPEFRFAYSQPASYEAVERREPELYKSTLQKIKNGQWQATGGMYVESDTLIACGEALARSFLLGQKEFARISGRRSRLTWLPDVFGYSACLPQLMKLMGLPYFFTTKMTWNAINRFPYSSFIWKGNDGSEVLSHVTQDSGYVTHMETDNIQSPMFAHQQADVHHEFLLPTGYGDGGGGPTHEMCERARRLDSLPTMPSISWEHPEAFFERLEKIKDQLPTHQGECYLEFHRGTYTTHGNLKYAFRNLEKAMQVAEAVSAMTSQPWEMDHAWKRLVFAQFHDYIPGSSVWDVYLEGIPEMESLRKDQLQKSLNALQKEKGSEICLFNPHPVPVKRWIQDPQSKKDFFVKLNPLSGTSLKKATQNLPSQISFQKKKVSNGLTSFALDKNGHISDLEWEGVSVPLQDSLGQLILYPDKAACFEAWDIDRHVLSLGQFCDTPAQVSTFGNKSHRGGFRVYRKIGESSHATVTYALEAGSPQVHITVELDWQEPEKLLKMIFPTQYAATHARFGIPYGSVLRPQVSNGMVAEAMWEVPFSRHLEVFDEGEREGLFLVTESKYGATVRNGTIGLSLVRSPRVNGFEMHGQAWPRHLSRLQNLSPYSDLGSHKIELALGRYDIHLKKEEQPAVQAEVLFTDPIFYRGKEIESPFNEIEGGETLVPSWAKPENSESWLLRLHETSGCRGKMIIHSTQSWEMKASDFEGQTEQRTKWMKKITVSYSPYQILTVRFKKVY